jgi:hypothetical protein
MMSNIVNFIKTVRALPNSRPIQGVDRDGIIEAASRDNNFCALKRYLEENEYIIEGDSTVFIMEDPQSDFKIYSFQTNYVRIQSEKSAELMFQSFPYRNNNVLISMSEYGTVQDIISIGKDGKIKSEAGNILEDIRNNISAWFTTTFRSN